MQYHVNELEHSPRIKTYDDYSVNGQIAIAQGGRESNGVKGLFAFHNHPHAEFITATTDYMHAYFNVIRDMLKTLQPTNSGDILLAQNINRTYKETVIASCKEDGFHKKLWTPPYDQYVPDWVFSKLECIKANKRMKSIIGPPGVMRISDVMKAGKGENTHDTLEWAFVFARWCWAGLGVRVYIENILEIFDVLCMLTASTIKIETVCSQSCLELFDVS
jgi:hypothetical protein